MLMQPVTGKTWFQMSVLLTPTPILITSVLDYLPNTLPKNELKILGLPDSHSLPMHGPMVAMARSYVT